MMPLSELFFIGIVCYLIYRFVFNFLLPVMRTTRHVREQFRNMQDTMQNQSGSFQRPGNGQADSARPNGTQSHGAQANSAQPRKPNSQSNNTMGEYIDFEEIK